MRSAAARHYGDLMVGRNQCDEDRRDGVIDVCRWRAKHALAACVQEAMLLPTLDRFAERGHGRSPRYR